MNEQRKVIEERIVARAIIKRNEFLLLKEMTLYPEDHHKSYTSDDT